MTATGPAGSAQLTCAGSLSLKDRSRPIRDADDLYLEVRHGARTLSKRVTISTEYLRLANFSFTGFLKNDTNLLAQVDSHVATKLPTRQCTSVKIQSPRLQQLLEARAHTHQFIERRHLTERSTLISYIPHSQFYLHFKQKVVGKTKLGCKSLPGLEKLVFLESRWPSNSCPLLDNSSRSCQDLGFYGLFFFLLGEGSGGGWGKSKLPDN